MLQSITIHNVAVIDRLHIEFQKGFSVFTGETGAGKSILLDSLSFVLGNRAHPSQLIREGETEASVSIVLDTLPMNVKAMLDEQGFNNEPPLIIRRIVNQDGKSKSFLNDQPISVGLLNKLSSHLIEIHGQFDHLLNPSQQLEALDRYANLSTSDLREAYSCWKETESTLHSAQVTSLTKENRLDELSVLIKELENLAPQAEEEERLLSLKQTEKHTEQIKTILHLINELSHNPLTIEARFLALQRNLDKLDLPSFSLLKQSVENILISLQDAQEEANRLAITLEASHMTLDQIETRLYTLRQIARKHNISPAELPQMLTDLREEHKNLIHHEYSLEHLHQQVLEAREAYKRIAAQAHDKRKKAGDSLACEIKKMLSPLKLPHTVFLVSFQELPETQWSAKGMHSIEFHVSTNPGISPGPLAKIASGGELSRIMLVLKSLLKEKNNIPTLIFDEIDIGLGGAVAAAMGEQLARLSINSQVVAITHSPQLAAYADYHFGVSKSVHRGKTTTFIQSLIEEEERIEELSRMLSGKNITDLTRAAARELLKSKVHT